MAKKLSVSPKGTFVYPWLNKPDTKFKEEGEYRVRLRCKADAPGVEDLIEAIDEGVAQAVATARSEAANPAKAKKVKPCEDKPYQMEEDDDGNETGYVLFNFKMKASGVSKKSGETWERRPRIFDATGTPLPKGTSIGGGTVGKISFELAEFYNVKLGAGVTLRMEGVQVIKLVEFGGRDAKGYGFGDESEDEDYEEPTAEAEEDEEEEEAEEAPPPKREKKSAKKATKKAKPADDDDDDDDDEDGDEDEDF